MGEAGFGRVGAKQPVSGERRAASSQHPIVTDTMMQVMADGGNAIDAAIAGCMVQAVVQQEMTNHTGTVSALIYEVETNQVHHLNSMGTIVPDLAPFRPVPVGRGLYAAAPPGPFAVTPGFMPGMKALFDRFGTRGWSTLVEPAVHWAEEGHEVRSFEHLVMAQTVDFFLYTESGRAHFTPDGHLPQVGDRWPRPKLAETMRRVAEEGPDWMITGGWAEAFVERANELGWDISVEHLTADWAQPRWAQATSYEHAGYEIFQPAPPERQAAYCAIVLGILEELEITELGHYTESAEALFYVSSALRLAHLATGYLNDPEVFGDPTPALLSRDFARVHADLLRHALPKVDLTQHVVLTKGPGAIHAAGGSASKQPAGSCELSIVDEHGNWVQMMNTLQSGGMPGEVVGGVPMVGSHGVTSLESPIGGWFTGGGRMRSIMSNTIVMKDGAPRLQLGSPGNVHCTVPQVLLNALTYAMDPAAAEDAPRMLPYTPDHTIPVESRLAAGVVDDVAKLGVAIEPLPTYDYHMGTYQMCWRTDDGRLHAATGPRRAGQAAAV